MDNTQKLIDVFRSALGMPDEVDIPSLKYRGIKEWDSVGHMQLVAAIETEFDVMLETSDILEMSSFVKAVELLQKQNVSFSP